MATTLRFTKAAIDALPLPATGKRDEYCDDRVDGLRLRVTSTGVKTFCVLKRLQNSSLERITVGRYPDVTPELARTKAKQIIAEIASGADPAQAKRTLRGEPTFAELFTAYLERYAKPRKRTWEGDEQRYRQYLETKLGNKRLSQIDGQMLRRLLDDITAAGHPVVANRVKALLSVVFKMGMEWGMTASNPATGIRGNPEVSRDRFLNGEELGRLIAALNDTPDDTIRDYVWLSLLTGARRSNVLGMRWADIDWQQKVWQIPAEDSKNGQPLAVVLTDAALEILTARKTQIQDSSPFVFPGTGATGHLVEPKKGWYALLNRAGLENGHLHDLRRTLASWQAIGGTSLLIIGKSLGHKSQQSTQAYARLNLDPVRASVEKATADMLANYQSLVPTGSQ